MIKVLFFIESLEHGGAEKSLLSLLHHLDYSKYEVEVVALKKNGALQYLLPPSVTFNHLDLKFGLIGKLKFRMFKNILSKRHNAQFFWKAFKNEIPNHPKTYDIAIGWGQGFATYYVAEKVNAHRKIAWINTNYDEAGYVFAHDRSIYEKYDKINGVSVFAVEVMSKYIADHKLTQITNVIDEDEVTQKSKMECPLSFNPDLFNIVSVGRLAKPKAFEISLKAAKILKDQKVNFHWYIIGDGSERAFLENVREKLGLVNEITFVGFEKNPYSFMQQANLYVQTSLFEGLGRTLIEASILRKPIVTTDFDTAYGLVDQYKTGIITPKEPQAIATAIYKLYTEKNTYLRMVENLESHSRIATDNVIKQFDALLKELTDSN
ncbi:glycosyltransferase [Kaistella carnis]|uniref:glycosyltransferase n=1 Tax=Kaistella carnis TaxID=1241979 RepID=UPI0028AC8D5D|nr:glycosyltransferase [Kaistella carnis]